MSMIWNEDVLNLHYLHMGESDEFSSVIGVNKTQMISVFLKCFISPKHFGTRYEYILYSFMYNIQIKYPFYMV